jgi:hypothetical protein
MPREILLRQKNNFGEDSSSVSQADKKKRFFFEKWLWAQPPGRALTQQVIYYQQYSINQNHCL